MRRFRRVALYTAATVALGFALVLETLSHSLVDGPSLASLLCLAAFTYLAVRASIPGPTDKPSDDDS